MEDGQAHDEGSRGAQHAAAERLVAKLQTFVSRELDEDERALFGALVVPGLAQALQSRDEVQGFAVTTWTSAPLPETLVKALRDSGLRLVDPGE